MLQERDSYFEVTGETAEELHAALLERGPTIEGVPLFACTEWAVRWRLEQAPARGECRLRRLEVELVVNTVLPRWPGEARAPTALRSQWAAFVAALRIHERGHRDLGARAASEALAALRSWRSARCGSLAEADAAAQRAVGRYRVRTIEYDRETRYGRTQGVAWPPPG